MEPRTHRLKNGLALHIREADGADAGAVLEYVEAISGESDFLTFGPGEFGHAAEEEEGFLRGFRAAENQLYLLALCGGRVVGSLHFAAGRRPRTRHGGEFGMSVRRSHWGLGIGSLLIDALLDWARATRFVTKVNLQVRTDNHRAIALYERKGFVKEGTIGKQFFLDGRYYDLHWMGLFLGDEEAR